MWKTLSIVAAILTAGAAYFSYQTVGQFRNERQLLEIAKANRSDATSHLEAGRKALAADTEGRKKTEADRDALVKKIDELNVQIADLTKQVADKKAELESATARWTEVKKSVDDLGGIDTLKNQLASLSQEKATLEGSIESLKQKTAMATERFNGLTKTIAAMKTKEAWQAQGIMEDNFRARVVQVRPDVRIRHDQRRQYQRCGHRCHARCQARWRCHRSTEGDQCRTAIRRCRHRRRHPGRWNPGAARRHRDGIARFDRQRMARKSTACRRLTHPRGSKDAGHPTGHSASRPTDRRS